MVAAEGLKGVMKNRRIGALLEPAKKLRERSGRVIADTRHVGHGKKLKCRIRCWHSWGYLAFRIFHAWR
jgi:hypothetical protein